MTDDEIRTDIAALEHLEKVVRYITGRLAREAERRNVYNAGCRAAEIREAGQMAISIEAAKRILE